MEILGMSLEAEPEWVAATIEQALGQAVVPVPIHVKRGRPRPLADAHHRRWRDALPPPWPDVQAEARRSP